MHVKFVPQLIEGRTKIEGRRSCDQFYPASTEDGYCIQLITVLNKSSSSEIYSLTTVINIKYNNQTNKKN
jgi:hypothetical protein